MKLVTLTQQQIGKITNNDDLFVYSKKLVDEYGICFTSGTESDYILLTNNEYIFEIVDQKKWAFTRIKYGI